MKPASEGHSRVHLYHELTFRGFVALPAGLNDNALTHLCRLEVLLPFVEPLAVVTGLLCPALHAFHAGEQFLSIRQTSLPFLIIREVQGYRYIAS